MINIKRFLLLVVTYYIFSQNVNAQTIDSASFRCLYKFKSIPNLLKPETTSNDEMMLLVGDRYSAYYSYKNYIYDSLKKYNPADVMPTMQEIDGRMNFSVNKNAPKQTQNVEKLFINRNNGELTLMAKIFSTTAYKYDEKLINPIWAFSTDTLKVLGYTCQKATTHYGGRDWTVWFTPEIAISEGPWKLRGLPGLILKAEDADKHFTFECTALERLRSKQAITMDTENEYRKLSKKDFTKELKYIRENPIASLASNLGVEITNIKTTNPNIDPNVTRKYNLIERE